MVRLSNTHPGHLVVVRKADSLSKVTQWRFEVEEHCVKADKSQNRYHTLEDVFDRLRGKTGNVQRYTEYGAEMFDSP